MFTFSPVSDDYPELSVQSLIY